MVSVYIFAIAPPDVYLRSLTTPGGRGRRRTGHDLSLSSRDRVLPGPNHKTIADMGRDLSWITGDIYFDFRSAQGARNTQVPADKIRGSRMRQNLVGRLKLIAPDQTPGIYETITPAIDLSRYSGFISCEWDGDSSFVRRTTRAAPSVGRWGTSISTTPF